MTTNQPIVEQKLLAFTGLQAEFEECFQFVEAVQGQKRFSRFTVADVVRYLHSLWIYDCKTNLLSVSKTVKEYDGVTCLQLLRNWQVEHDTASVVAFLYRKLDMLPFADITQQVQEAIKREEKDVTQRLLHGRSIMLNRGFNLLNLLDALFRPSPEQLYSALYSACEHYKHLPESIDVQISEMSSPLYAFVPHQMLAQRNMLVMNKMGIHVASNAADIPSARTEGIEEPSEPFPPFAEQVVPNYQDMTSVAYNNLNQERFFTASNRSQDHDPSKTGE